MSRIKLPGTSLERQIKTSPGRHFRTSPERQIGTSPGRSNRIFRGRPRDVLGTSICRLGSMSCDNVAITKNTKVIYIYVYINGKTLDQHKTTINLKFLLQLGMMNLICLMDLILLQTSKTTFNLSSKARNFS